MYFCVLCIVCFVTFPVLFVCVCVLNNCHRVATQLQLNIYHIISYIKYVQSGAMWGRVEGAWRPLSLDHSVPEDGDKSHLRNVTTDRHDIIRRLASCTSTAVRTSDGASIKISFHLPPESHVMFKQKGFSWKFGMNFLFPHSTNGCEAAQKVSGQGQSNPPGSVLPFQAGIMSRDLLSEP